nr:mediator of RNA polymerase II transcription subunit 15A-like [Ipomoea batatas]
MAVSQIQVNKEQYYQHSLSTTLEEQWHRDWVAQPPNAELSVKYENTRVFVEKMIKFLQMFKVDFIQHSKEKVCQYMNLITNYLDEVRMKNSAALQKHRSAATSARAFLLNSSGEVSIKGCEAAETLSTRTEIFKIANLDSTLSNRDHATSLPANTVNPFASALTLSQKAKQPMWQAIPLALH